MYHLMTKFWWILALRGIAGIILSILAFALLIWTNTQSSDIFGLYIFAKMASVVSSIIFLLGLYALIDGLFSIILGVQDYGGGRHWKPLIVEGLLSMVLGLVTLLWPDNAVMMLLFWVAAWAFVTGLLEIQEGFDLNEYKERRPPFLLAGICSILFGCCIIFLRVSGLELVEVIGGYAFVFGVLLLIFAYRLRRFTKYISRVRL
jgi:uncharacterized membrane protein HdeD (DUF308 family)